MNEIQAFNKLLLKFKFINEVPLNVQEYVSESQRKALISSLKQLGLSSLFYSVILQIYFGIRKKGYGISLSMSKTIVWTLISIASFSAVGGAVYIAANLNKGKTMIEQTLTTDNKNNESLKLAYQKYRLGIGQFMSRNNDNELAEKITGIMADELTALLGKDYVLVLDTDRKGKKVNLVLVGAVGKLGHELIISTKIIDVENSQVLFAENVQVLNDTEIVSKARYLSEKIAKYFNQKYKE